MSVEAKLMELKIELPEPLVPAGNYVGAKTVGKLVYLSGEGPRLTNGVISGKLGEDLSVEEGQEAARLVGLNMLTTLRNHIGDLDRVKQVVKVLAWSTLYLTSSNTRRSSMAFPT